MAQPGIVEPRPSPAAPQQPGTPAPKKRPDAFFIAAVVWFAIPAVVALTSYPRYFEDESWCYLAVLEALRGNGFSWAAFHEGSSIFGTFHALTYPFFAVSPFAPEVTVRLVSFLFALCCLAGVFALARRIAGATGYVALVVLLSTPIWFLSIRYGRMDSAALAFAVWALVASTRGFPVMAGILSGLAVAIHPVFVWLALPCLLPLVQERRWRECVRYGIGGIAGAAPQIAWMATHISAVRSISTDFFVTASVGHGWSAWLASLIGEWRRYATTAAGIPMLIVLPFVVRAVRGARGRERTLLIVIAAAPLLGLTFLVQGKNPYYYIVFAIPFLAVVAAAGVQRLPGRTVKIVCIVALSATSIWHLDRLHKATRLPAVTTSVGALAARLPKNATVFSPLLYAGLVQRRPDLQFFAYHALSTHPGWALPSCSAMPATIRALVENDPRPTSRAQMQGRDSVFFVMGPAAREEAFLQYLRLIYVTATAADMRCIVGLQKPVVLPVCGTDPNRCVDLYLVERRLQ